MRLAKLPAEIPQVGHEPQSGTGVQCRSAAKRQGEVYHRYVLGVYELQRRLTEKYPHLLLENCAGGGARFDCGMLYYSPQIWCSDNTDARSRLVIQYGTSLFYPGCVMGAHFSTVPNHCTGHISTVEHGWRQHLLAPSALSWI